MDFNFQSAISTFNETIKSTYGSGLNRHNKKEIETESFAFARKISIATGIDHEALVQFSDEHDMAQITIKSRDETFCFIRAGGNDE